MDLEQLLEPIDPESPCGPEPDVQYAARLYELESQLQSQDGGIIAGGDAGPGTDWKQIGKISAELFESCKHLRPAVCLAAAWVHLDGVEGLVNGLRLLRELVERYWDEVHPRLDPDDHFDPTERLNILGTVATPLSTYGDPVQFLQAIRDLPIVDAGQMGRFTVREAMLASGRTSASESETPPSSQEVEGAFAAEDAERLQERERLFHEAVEQAEVLDSLLGERVEASSRISLDPLHTMLSTAHKELLHWLPQSMAPQGADGAGLEEFSGESGGVQAAEAGGRGGAGGVNSREDVARLLGEICGYYERHEPSSPLPLLLKRARSLVYKDFASLIRELSPNAEPQISLLEDIDAGDDSN